MSTGVRGGVNVALGRFGMAEGELLTWIRDVAGEPSSPRILNDKGWSVVLHFGVAVVKITSAGYFPYGPKMFALVSSAEPLLTPALMDWRTTQSGHQLMMFLPFEGARVDELVGLQRQEGVVRMASSAARIQSSVRSDDFDDVESARAIDVPKMFDEIMEGAVGICTTDYIDRWSEECDKQQVDPEFVKELGPWRKAISDWAIELEAMGWSNSIDHVDLLPHNAVMVADDQCLIYDWEQATRGVPFFSIDVLLAYAQSIDEGHDGLELLPERPTFTQAQILSAYRSELSGPVELALLLSPIRYCWSEWRQAVRSNVAHYGVDDVAWWLSRGLRRWTAA